MSFNLWVIVNYDLIISQSDMPPTSLTKEQTDKLRELWEAGLTSVGDKRKIHAAVEATGLYEKTIKVMNISPCKSLPHHRPCSQSIFC